jgi:hypothetical protein
MSYITGNLPPIKVWVKEEYLYNDPFRLEKKDYKLLPGILLTVRCLTGQVPLFQILINNGVVRDKLPSSAFLTTNERPEKELSFDELCLWNSFSNRFSIYSINYLYNANLNVYFKDKQLRAGNYLFTIDWSTNDFDNDLTLSEDPAEHKSHHVIELKDGQIAIQPNNRIVWSEPSFVTEKFPEKPDYKVNTFYWDAEAYLKWKTENSDNYYYETE